MSIVSSGRKIPCRIRVPEHYLPKARYALEALLVPLGLEPVFEGKPRIVYGDAEAEGDAVHLDDSPAASTFFERRRPYAASDASTVEFERTAWPVPFRASDGSPDLVASTFLFLSGWHEAATQARDEHGRVPFEATLPAVLDVYDRPVVDTYRQILATRLERAGIECAPRRWGRSDWALCPTHDIDYVRKWRPGIIYREIVEHFLLNRRHDPTDLRLRRLSSSLRQMAGGDPYRRAFVRMTDEVEHRGGTATYFIKAGAGDPHDVPYALDGVFIRQRLEDLKRRGFEIGLHPSYLAVEDADRLGAERRILTGEAAAPLSVRQHYLRYDPLTTSRMHESLGFHIDSTIGYADRTGFRRGTCVPHRLYDLESDRLLDVWEMPLIVMESALFNRERLSLEEAVAVTESRMEMCRRFGGACVMLWHNTLWDEVDCPNWGAHFTRTLDAAVDRCARLTSLAGGLREWR